MRLDFLTPWLTVIVIASIGSLMQAQPELSTPLGQRIRVSCDHPPTIICPADFESCPGVSTEPANTGYAIGFSPNPFCSPPSLRYEDEVISKSGCKGSMVIFRTWIATDLQDTSLHSSCVQKIILSDTIAPLIIDCPKDTTLAPNGGCFANYFWDQPLVLDNCGNLNLTVSHVSGDRFPLGQTTVTYKATDGCGNVFSCSFIITVKGDCCDLPPTIVCPGDFTGCPGDTIRPKKIGRAIGTAGRPNCDPPAVFYRDDTISNGPCKGGFVIERLWTAVDPYDPSLFATCVQRIELKDERNPFIFGCPPDISVDSDEDCIAIVNWVEPTAVDNCDGVKLESNYNPRDTFKLGMTTVTYLATDSCGNITKCSFVVTVIQKCCNENPIIHCPGDYIGCPNSSLDPNITGTATGQPRGPFCDDPVIRFEDTLISEGPCFGQKKIKRLWIAQDPKKIDLRSTCVQFITLIDTIKPVFSYCPSDTTLSPNDECEAIYTWTTTASDNCGSSSITSSHSSGDTFQLGITTVVITAKDLCGNTTTCSFVITVKDDCCNKPPKITCPQDYNGCPGADISPDFIGNPFVKKGARFCNDPIVTYKDDTLSLHNCPGSFTIERTWTATDPNKSTLNASCVQTIILNDTIPPVFSNCPGDTLVTPNKDCQAIVSWSRPGISDNCGIASVTTTHMPGDTFLLGHTTVTYTLTDICGNTATCSFVIAVKDDCCNKPLVITCPSDYEGCPSTSLDPSVTGLPTVVKGHVICDDPSIDYIDNVITTGPCRGATSIERMWIAVDPNNHTLADTCIQKIVLKDDIKPVLANCIGNITLSPNVGCEARVTWRTPTATDNCGTPTVTSSHISGHLFPIGSTTVVFTATDGCGNTASCFFVITVKDDCCNKPPVITCPSDYENCPSTSLDPSVTGMPMVVKGHVKCDDPTVDYVDNVISTGPCTGATSIERMWIAVDPNDPALADTCIQKIALKDDENPILNDCPGDFIANADETCKVIITWTPPTATDNCAGVVLSSTHNPGDTFYIGITTVVYTATDACGNTTSCSFIVDIAGDNLHIMCPNDTLIAHPSYNFGHYVYWDAPEVIECNSTCTDTLPGFIYMGERNGHRYFCSKYRASWKDAQNDCESFGGYLAVVNDASENAYLANLLMGQPAYIGLNDFANEGEFEWVNGDPLNFTNWAVGQPDDKNNYQDAVELYPNGNWKDQFYYIHNEFICEIPCYTVKQIKGPKNGGFFNCGKTIVTYVAEDGKGETDTCSFVVDVDCSGYQPYCKAKGLNSSDFWIENIIFGGLNLRTGNDWGYGDYLANCIDLTSGTTEQLCVGIGYGGLQRTVYWRAWIDYNNDKDFKDHGEEVARGYGNTIVCDDVRVPANLNVRTVMRVAISYGSWPETCGSVNQGEYEDYCIVIEDGTATIVQKGGLNIPDRKVDQTIEEDEESGILLYPNPANDIIIIKWMGERPLNYSVVDIFGRSLLDRSQEVTKNDSEIQVSQWKEGRYVIIAEYEDGRLNYRPFVVIKK